MGLVNEERLAELWQKIKDKFAKKEIYGDDHVSLGREADTVVGGRSFAFGSRTTASGNYSHAEGLFTSAFGECAHAEGRITIASGDYSHAEGYYYNIASGKCAHAEGHGVTATGMYSHAEGDDTSAGSECAHAEGYHTTASGKRTHAEGYCTTASGANSHAEGCYTKASSHFQHVQGKYNICDYDQKYAHIVGNGTSDDTRSNAHTVDWEGNAWYAGDVENGAGVTMNGLKKEIDTLKASGGSGGTSDYEELSNRPQIEGVELSGNKTLADFGITEMTYEETLAVLNETEGAA